MAVGRARSDSDALGGVVNGYAPLNSSLRVPATYARATGCIVVGTSTALSTGAYTSLAFASTDTFDSDAFHDPASNNTRLTVPTGLGGVYRLRATCSWPGTTSLDRRIGYRISAGADVLRFREYLNQSSGVTTISGMTIELVLAAGDYIEVRQFTDAASTTTTDYSASLFLIGN